MPVAATTNPLSKPLSLSDNNIVKELVFEENLVLISSPGYNDLEAVCSNPFLMNSVGCPNRLQLENWLKLKGITKIRFMEFNNLNSIIKGVIADLGASFVPKSAIKKYEEREVFLDHFQYLQDLVPQKLFL